MAGDYTTNFVLQLMIDSALQIVVLQIMRSTTMA
jgi:hypothetical protein